MTSSAISQSTGRLSREQELHWLALKMVPGLGTRKSYSLVQHFRSAEAVFQAEKRDLEGQGISSNVAQTIVSGCTFEDAVDQHQRLLDFGAHMIPMVDSRYPAPLRDIYDPPLLLFAKGRLELLDSVMIGVVGTRRPTAYGVAAADRLSSDLAKAGLTIVSGMASGIDTAAHKAALAVDGATIAVFGCGVDLVYPSDNRRLATSIAEKGLLLSEFPMGTPPFPQNFPVRNRIISGMSLGVLVVEGAQYSGSSITARIALDQQREVFAVPGNITSKMSWGPNLLIKQGAKLVQEWNDVVAELPQESRRRLVMEGQRMLGLTEAQCGTSETEPDTPQSRLCKDVLRKLSIDTPLHLDGLLESFESQSSSELIAALFELEIMGAVKQLPGKKFVKAW